MGWRVFNSIGRDGKTQAMLKVERARNLSGGTGMYYEPQSLSLAALLRVSAHP
jgi:hypothetical protein